MVTAYKILFAIDLQNEYYRNGKCTDITLVPSAETRLLLKNRQMLYKMVGNKFVVLVKVRDKSAGANANKPYIPFNGEEKFTFFLQLDKPVFTTITNIDFELFSSKRFYFSNIFQTKIDTELHLSATIDVYDNAKNYEPGDMVSNGTGSVFECIKTTVGNNTSAAAFWFNRAENTFASKKDMYAFLPRVTNFRAKTAATSFNIKILAFNTATKLFDTEVKIKNSFITTGNISTRDVQVNMQNLPNGRYVIKINNEDYENGTDTDGNPIPFYLSDDVVYNNYLGVAEIFSQGLTDPDFTLLDTDGKVKDIVTGLGKSTWLNYLIRFANKMATWKYIAALGKVTSIDGSAESIVFSKTTIDQQDIFESNRPIRLSEKPVVFDLLLTNAVSSQPPPAPNPDPLITGIISRSDADYFCTIYLNY